MGNSISSLFFELLDFFLLLEEGHFFALQSFLDFLAEPFDSSAEQVQVLVPLFCHLGGVFYPWFFVVVVDDDDFVFFVFVGEQLRHVFVLLDPRSWVVQGLLDVVLVVLFGFSEVDEEEVSFDSDGELFGFDGYGGEVGMLADCVFFRFVPVVDRFALFLLGQEFPDGAGFDPPEKFSLLLRRLLVTYLTRPVLINSMSLTVVPCLPASFDSTWSYLLVLGILTSSTEGLPGWYPIGLFYIF